MSVNVLKKNVFDVASVVKNYKLRRMHFLFFASGIVMIVSAETTLLISTVLSTLLPDWSVLPIIAIVALVTTILFMSIFVATYISISNRSDKFINSVESWLKKQDIVIDPIVLRPKMLAVAETREFSSFAVRDADGTELMIDGSFENGLFVSHISKIEKQIEFNSTDNQNRWSETFDQLNAVLFSEEEKQALKFLKVTFSSLVNSGLSDEQKYNFAYVINELKELKVLLTEISKLEASSINSGKVSEILSLLSSEIVNIRDEKTLELTKQLDMKLSVLRERNFSSTSTIVL